MKITMKDKGAPEGVEFRGPLGEVVEVPLAWVHAAGWLHRDDALEILDLALRPCRRAVRAGIDAVLADGAAPQGLTQPCPIHEWDGPRCVRCGAHEDWTPAVTP